MAFEHMFNKNGSTFAVVFKRKYINVWILEK